MLKNLNLLPGHYMTQLSLQSGVFIHLKCMFTDCQWTLFWGTCNNCRLSYCIWEQELESKRGSRLTEI